MVPEPLRHARLHRDLGERDRPGPVKRVLDHLVRPGADPARGQDEVDGVVGARREGLVEGPEELLDVVGHEAQDSATAPASVTAAASIGPFDS